jgi:DNA/RNA-binding domain of Phe-tRNA-synthetase-like protein
MSEQKNILMLKISETWCKIYPGAAVGLLAMKSVLNPSQHIGLEQKKLELEATIRQRYAGLDKTTLKTLPVLQAYAAYYKRFSKTFHVQLQLESMLFKGKSLPRIAALVETLFMAELDNLLLTAGHDLDHVKPPLRLDIGKGDEKYITLNRREVVIKPGDMFIADSAGILSSIIGGPDQRTRITSATQHALFTVYAPPGIGEAAVRKHLQDIQAYVLLIAPQAEVEALEIHCASDLTEAES